MLRACLAEADCTGARGAGLVSVAAAGMRKLLAAATIDKAGSFTRYNGQTVAV